MFHPDWLNFLDAINKAKLELGFEKNEECFYRGHSQTNWDLSPGLFRNVAPYRKKFIPDYCWDNECDLYYEFRSRARVLHNQNMSDWDVLFIMQYHGVRTRILDWTEMLSSALYFALDGCDKQGYLNKNSPCIWLMNPYKLNEIYHAYRELWDPEFLDTYDGDENYSYGELLVGDHSTEQGEMFTWDDPVAIYPLRKDDRLTNQGGYFTIHGNNILPLNKRIEAKEYLRDVQLPENAFISAFEFLDAAGVNDFTMYPDLDGLAKYLNKKYR